jgi:aldehyde dehydrogenase (NAD+)
MHCSGQTCVAPDYVLVVPSVEQQLIEKLKKYVTQFYGEDPFKVTSIIEISMEFI